MSKTNGLYQDTIEAALTKCEHYNAMGGLDNAVIRDIAHDAGVDFQDLLEHWERR